MKIVSRCAILDTRTLNRKGTDEMKPRPLIAAYYFPNWHCDPRIEALHGKGWTEWRVVRYATPRFPGHRQPRIPLWGYQDEADPEVMAQKITAARAYGIDVKTQSL